VTNAVVQFAGSGSWRRTTRVEPVWGTVVTFDVRGDHADPDAEAALGAAAEFLHQVDRWFSTYRAESPITLHRNAIASEAQLPIEVQRVLSACGNARRITRGYFDPWAVPGGVDPSGYVKGWAAGVAADQLVAQGFSNVLVNASGDIAARGEQSPGQRWQVGVINPYDTQQIIRVVELSDEAMATSGLYERGHHIVNPRDLSRDTYYDSATIVGPDAGLADALATATLIAGPACAEWFGELGPQWSAYFVKDGQADFFGPAFDDTAMSSS